ncbi:MAG: MotA/TolQ/ExbB proton channel family protein [Deltaproteobacteria bacterium]|nr:MotA/TolQ/ExbB proton channel family protein [Deltaproteobacteria bacterium]
MSFSLIEVWNAAGLVGKGVFVLLAVMSIYSLGLVAERLMKFGAARRQSLAYVEGLKKALEEGKLEDAAKSATQHPESPVAQVVAAGVEAYVLGVRDLAKGKKGVDLVEALDRNLERVRDRQVSRLKRGLSGLATIGSTAPFVGLFGTVVGIIKAFTSMSSTGSGGLSAVSADIAEALVATGLGLFVAIPAVALFNYLTTKVDELVVDMNDVSGEVVAYVLRTGHENS